MQTISFFAAGIPMGQPRIKAAMRSFGGKTFAHVYTPGTSENWKSCIAHAARAFVPAAPYPGPVQIDCTFYLPRPKGHYGTGKNAGVLKDSSPMFHLCKPDIDNALKVIFDTLVYLRFILDDTQICETWSKKLYENADCKPGCQITLIPLENRADTRPARTVLNLQPALI